MQNHTRLALENFYLFYETMAGIEPYQHEPMASHNVSVDWSSEDDENFETQHFSREIDVAEW